MSPKAKNVKIRVNGRKIDVTNYKRPRHATLEDLWPPKSGGEEEFTKFSKKKGHRFFLLGFSDDIDDMDAPH